jgi:periplasmic copper chaperone A
LKLRPIAAAVAVGALLVPAAASAHVTLQPKAQTAGAYTVVAVRVPNEQDKASTTKVKVDFPAGIYGVSYMPKPGWKTTVTMAKLATPVQTEDGPITEQVGSVTFTGTGKGLGRIAPGQFQEFPLSLQMPNTPGATIAFPAYQWYSNGDLVKWTGAAGADTPAPTISLAAPVTTLRSAPVAVAAHAPVTGRTPAPGSKVSNVKSVNVTFGEGVVTGLISVKKGGQEVKPKSTGLAKKNTVLQATFAKALSKGSYTVEWRARADDGHSETGTWSFTVR